MVIWLVHWTGGTLNLILYATDPLWLKIMKNRPVHSSTQCTWKPWRIGLFIVLLRHYIWIKSRSDHSSTQTAHIKNHDWFIILPICRKTMKCRPIYSFTLKMHKNLENPFYLFYLPHCIISFCAEQISQISKVGSRHENQIKSKTARITFPLKCRKL